MVMARMACLVKVLSDSHNLLHSWLWLLTDNGHHLLKKLWPPPFPTSHLKASVGKCTEGFYLDLDRIHGVNRQLLPNNRYSGWLGP